MKNRWIEVPWRLYNMRQMSKMPHKSSKMAKMLLFFFTAFELKDEGVS